MASTMADADKSPQAPVDVKALEANGADTVVLTMVEGEMNHIDPKAERSLVWKFDLRILPVLAVMYLFNSLDKGNLGNAKTAGLLKTLHMSGQQYNTALSVFYVPYVLTAPILGILGKKYGPSRVLPLMMFTFGFCTVMMVAVKNFAGVTTRSRHVQEDHCR